MLKKSLLLLASMSVASVVWAGDLTLLITHDTKVLAADGITRTSHFQEKVYRQQQNVWVERVLPPHAHEQSEHQTDAKEHKHLDMDAAARWITKADQTKARIRLVNVFDKQIVNVTAGDYDAVGFDGQWNAAYSLMDPRQIKALQPSKRAAPIGSQWYEGQKDGNYLRVLWDNNLAIPRRVESGNSVGTQQRLMQVEVATTPKQMPWQTLKGYQEKDYSDFLD
jgi:hypothetical protein